MEIENHNLWNTTVIILAALFGAFGAFLGVGNSLGWF